MALRKQKSKRRPIKPKKPRPTVAQRKRSEAAKRGWEKRRSKEAAKLERFAAKHELDYFFSNPPLGGEGGHFGSDYEMGWPAEFEKDIDTQWVEIELHTRERLQDNGLLYWTSPGLRMRVPNQRRDRYEKEGKSNSMVWLYPSFTENLGKQFLEMRALVRKMVEQGYVITSLGLRGSTSEDRPEHWRNR